jgi:hypothetical protein
VHRGRRGRGRRLVRAALPVLRITDRSSGVTAKNIACDYPEYYASRDHRPDSVPDGIPNGIPNGIPDSIPDRFTIRISDSIAVKASQPVSTRPDGRLSAIQLSYAQALADKAAQPPC